MDLREELFENLDEVVKEIPGIDPESAYYIASRMKLDQGIERMFEILKEKGELNNTVIVLFGDHYPYGITAEASLDYFFDKEAMSYEKYKVPFIIYDPNDKGEVMSKLSSSSNIYPTLVNLFSLNEYTQNAFITGNDLFSKEDSRVVFPNGSIVTEDYFHDSIHMNTTFFREKYDVNEENVRIQELLEYSQLILELNYYRNH